MSLTGPYDWLRLRLPQPWSRLLGELAHMRKMLAGDEGTRRTFAEEKVIETIGQSFEHSEAVGVGLSERVVEIPWVFRQLARAPRRRVLDVGTAFAPMVYKRLLVRQQYTVEIADLAKTRLDRLKCHVADIRSLPFATDTFDVAICLSTLEHIGMDNRQYKVESRSDGADDVDALRELGRVASVVLVTVPAGHDSDMGWQRQYAPATFRRTVDAAGLTAERLDLFVHDPISGWMPADDALVESRTYGQGATAAAASICAVLSRR